MRAFADGAFPGVPKLFDIDSRSQGDMGAAVGATRGPLRRQRGGARRTPQAAYQTR